LDPQNPQGYIFRGSAYRRQNLPDKAIGDFTKLIELQQPTNSGAYFWRARAYFEAGKYKDARSDFEEIIRLNPTNSFGYLELAWCLATCPDASFRNGKEALELAQKGCALETNQDDCAYALAVASAEVGNFDDAVRNQNQTIRYLRRLADKSGIDGYAKALARQKEILELFEQHKPYHGVVKLSDWDD
jgi:tetratricopeptide (TPR) repeat protein